jgi:hypothetical protein
MTTKPVPPRALARDRYCGCCGESWIECRCPDGPTLLPTECYRRWKAQACTNCPKLDALEDKRIIA